jgi:hypothetical protein
MNLSRRGFINASAAVPLVNITPQQRVSEEPVLRMVMEAIIPAGDGMPSAIEAGGLAYVAQLMEHEPDMAKQLRHALGSLEAFSMRRFDRPFTQLGEEDRVAALEELERDAPPQFALLRDMVYESYYTQPVIWQLIGYVPYPADHQGPHLQPFDESLLADVRKRAKLYREA